MTPEETSSEGSAERPERIAFGSENDVVARIDALRDILPEAFVDNIFDPQRAAEALGLATAASDRYGLSWAGKDAALQALRMTSVATLRPNPHASSDFDHAGNILIEGDNLEVLRLLQRPYGGQVKMIYIDPPYNTGGDFIYRDNFRDGLDAYLRFTGQTDDSGEMTSSSGETAGRYHSQWLSMMYPRMALARNLLRRDGVIFVSIDDHEVHNLRLLMDEVFGPENFVATVIWQKVYSPKSSARHFSEDHDYVLVYARDAAEWRPGLLPRTEEQDAAYSNPDDDPRGPWKPSDVSARNYYAKGTYEVQTPDGRLISGPPSGRYWGISEEKFRELDEDGRIWWGSDGGNIPAVKRFLSDVMEGRVPQTLWKYQEVGHNQEAKKELLDRVEFESSESVFDTPKPTRLVRRMLTLATEPNAGDVVLDFFAGSGTTADAILQANAEDGGNRRFICVQAPEETGHGDFETVVDIARARISAAREEVAGTMRDEVGLRDLSLARSNFKVWDPEAIESEQELEDRIRLFEESLADDATDDGILVELMLAEGIRLDEPIERREMAGQEVVLIGPQGRRTAVWLGRQLPEDFDDLMDQIAGSEADRVIVLDAAFAGHDSSLLDMNYRLQRAGKTLRTV